MSVRTKDHEPDLPHDLPHVLPRPRPAIDPLRAPFVGNASVDDNLAECGQIAMWNAVGDADRKVRLSVDCGVATLRGELPTAEQRAAVEVAVASVGGISGVVNELRLEADRAVNSPAGQPKVALVKERVKSRSVVYVVRFCGLDEASTTAAIRQAIAALDGFFASRALARSETLMVVYRNRLPETVTLEIGYPADASVAATVTGEFKAGLSPGGTATSLRPDRGFAGVIEAQDRLAARATEAGYRRCSEFWQSFDSSDFRPWNEHPVRPLMVVIQPVKSLRGKAPDIPRGLGRGQGVRRLT